MVSDIQESKIIDEIKKLHKESLVDGIYPTNLYLGIKQSYDLRKELHDLRLAMDISNVKNVYKTDEEFFESTLFMGMKVHLVKEENHLFVV